MIGSIGLCYPVSKTRLSLQLNNSTSLPIGLASEGHTRLVIPPDTPEVHDSDLETLHFLSAIVFRTLIVGVDFCTGSSPAALYDITVTSRA